MNYCEFLEKFHGSGPYNLVAIHPTSTIITAGTFTTLDAVEAWVKKHNGTWNLYFTVNSLRQPIDKKPSRADIKSMDWLHVDIDVQAGEGLQAGLERIRALRPEGVPPPTGTIFSGGGYQLYWKLKEPFIIDGEESKYQEAKLYNVFLEQAYGGDSCHNVDRIMRLPGTMNLPTKKKLQKHPDRKAVKAEVVEWFYE